MNPRTNHKEFILMIGVVVAVLVIFLLWFSQTPSGPSTGLEKTDIVPQLITPLKEGFVKKTMVELSRIVLGN